MKLKKGDIVFHNWIVEDAIGEGSFGTVYKITREEFGRTYQAAAKVISIPGERKGLHETEEGMTTNNVAEYYRSQMEAIVEECDLMERMKGNSHIVSYEDHYVEPEQDGKGFTIYIRMELLTPFVSLMQDEEKRIGRDEAIKLGIDLCKGLSTCQKFQVVHRDIKIENLFVSEIGNYKLGDFGISKTMQESELAISKKGSQLYMAPEIFRAEKYDATVDIYSLGIVLYRLMNHNRLPFLPPYPETIYYQDKKKALYRRLSGERLPAPCDADEEFADVILKAASYMRKDRYQSAEEMREALEQLQHGKSDLRSRKAKKKKSLKVASMLILFATCGILLGTLYYKSIGHKNTCVVMSGVSSVDALTEKGIPYLLQEGEATALRVMEERYMTVPDVVELKEEDAFSLLKQAGYEENYIHVEYVYDDEVPAGVVIMQSVKKEQKVLRSDEITVTISQGVKPKKNNDVPKDNKQDNNEDSDWIWKAL